MGITKNIASKICIPCSNVVYFRYWILAFPMHVDVDSAVRTALREFHGRMREEGVIELSELVDISKVPSYDWMRVMSVRNSVSRNRNRKVTLVFNHLEPEELADHLTFLELRVMRRITVSNTQGIEFCSH